MFGHRFDSGRLHYRATLDFKVVRFFCAGTLVNSRHQHEHGLFCQFDIYFSKILESSEKNRGMKYGLTKKICLQVYQRY